MAPLDEHVQLLLSKAPNPALNYFAITISVSENGKLGYSCYSGWVGFTDDSPRREIREASLVNADRVIEVWREIGETAMVIDSPGDMSIYFLFGGHAVVEQAVARAVIPEWLAPTVVANVGQLGFASVEALPSGALQRAPTAKHRMRILQRDNYRCRICGRSPRDYVDLELHVHHIRPWAIGGITEDSNLVTLCHTCHNGLEPHFEFSLYQLLPHASSDELRIEYWTSLHRYQEQILKQCGDGGI